MKKNKFRWMLCIFVLLFLVSTVIGCGKTDKDKKPSGGGETNGEGTNGSDEPEYDFGGRVIKVATWWDDNLPERGEYERGDKILDRLEKLEKKYNATMEYVSVPMDQYLEKFTSSTLAGQPWADVLEMHVMWFYPGLVSSGFLYNLSSLEAFDFTESKWNSTILKYGEYKGNIYGIGTGRGGEIHALFWNKTMFEREGQPDLYELQDKKEWTWEKMREIAKNLTRDTDGDGVIDQWGLSRFFLDNSVIASNGSNLIGVVDDEPKFELATPNGIEALQFLQDLNIKDNVIIPPVEGANWDYDMQQFAAGNIGMIVGQLWTNGTYAENMEDEYGYVCFPMGPKMTEYISTSSGFNLTVFPSTVKKPEEVAMWWNDWREYLEGEDENTWKEDWLEEGFTGDRESGKTIVYLNENNLFEANMSASFPTAESYIMNAISQVRNGEKTPQSAIDEIKEAVEQNLADIMEELQEE